MACELEGPAEVQKNSRASGYIRKLFQLAVLSVDEAQGKHESEFEELETPSLP